MYEILRIIPFNYYFFNNKFYNIIIQEQKLKLKTKILVLLNFVICNWLEYGNKNYIIKMLFFILLMLMKKNGLKKI